MKTSQQLLKDANITPRLRLGQRVTGENGKESVQSTGPHRVKIIKDKLDKGTDRSGKTIDVVKYLVTEGGTHKFYTVPKLNKDTGELHYLVQRLAEIAEGTEIILEMKKLGPKNYVSVVELGKSEEHIELTDEEEIGEPSQDGQPDII